METLRTHVRQSAVDSVWTFSFVQRIMSSPSQAARNVLCLGDPDAFASEMIKMINDKEFSDVRFLVGEERQVIYAHRCMLAARCEVFRAMFAVRKGEEGTAPLVLSDTKPSVFLGVMEFIYTNSCSLSVDMAVDIVAAAIEYGLDGLTRICVRFMRDTIAYNNVCEFLQAALTYNQATLQEECLLFIEQNTEEVFKSRGFTEMSEDTLAFILKSDGLRMDEVDILEKVTEWATVNSVVLGTTLDEAAKNVMVHVRLPLLDPDVLSQLEKENQKKKYIPVIQIAATWRFHALKKPDPLDPSTRPRAGTIPRESLRVLGLAP